MVITSGDVAMRSGRTYRQQTRDRSSTSSWGEVLSATTSPTATESRTITQREHANEVVELYQNYSSGGRLVSSSAEVKASQEDTALQTTEVTQTTGVTQITTVRPLTLREFFSLLLARRREEFERFMEHYRIGIAGGGVLRSQTVTVSFGGQEQMVVTSGKRLQVRASRMEAVSEFSETEETFTQASGRVKTADGREIDFDLSLTLGRGFSEKKEAASESLSVKLTDPLVINFDTASAELTDQTFRFDIDGKLDNIALLGQASGYLALDRNDDGVINDGSELFGTKSGDGFADLRIYDADGNGWIDENDPVFDRLKIWSKDADGNDELVGLGIRGIGAIFLGSTPGEFSLKNAVNDTLGVIRSTGVFLREDGTAGTVQQLDLARRQPDTRSVQRKERAQSA